MRYLHERRAALGGYMPTRRPKADETLAVPELGIFAAQLASSEDRTLSTTMGLVRILSTLIKQKGIGERVVPIVPDEARTFGMEGMFRQLGIYSPVGQLYEPEDAGQMMYYREDTQGRILEEGINEAGAFSAWLAAATAYSHYNLPMIPVYLFYSMFGFQRIGDLAWAAGDMQARGFLIGATAGRTTLNGEGLQHQDGHSHLLASTIPNCVAYDAAFNAELAVIVHHGLKRMIEQQENVYFYLTTMNENYRHPALPEGAEAGVIKGMYRLQVADDPENPKLRVNLLGSGAILNEVLAAAEILASVYGVAADVWSVTSFSELRREGLAVARYNLLHPEETPREAYVTRCLKAQPYPIVAASDYMKIVAEQIRPFIHGPYLTLGTDGYGRSDTREQLRRHFEVDRYFIAVAALNVLADKGVLGRSRVADAIARFQIDPDKLDPVMV